MAVVPPITLTIEDVMDELFMQLIKEERAYQESKGVAGFDEQNKNNDWVAYISKYAARGAVSDPGEDTVGGEEFKKAMVKVATLAYSALMQHFAKAKV